MCKSCYDQTQFFLGQCACAKRTFLMLPHTHTHEWEARMKASRRQQYTHTHTHRVHRNCVRRKHTKYHEHIFAGVCSKHTHTRSYSVFRDRSRKDSWFSCCHRFAGVALDATSSLLRPDGIYLSGKCVASELLMRPIVLIMWEKIIHDKYKSFDAVAHRRSRENSKNTYIEWKSN